PEPVQAPRGPGGGSEKTGGQRGRQPPAASGVDRHACAGQHHQGALQPGSLWRRQSHGGRGDERRSGLRRAAGRRGGGARRPDARARHLQRRCRQDGEVHRQRPGGEQGLRHPDSGALFVARLGTAHGGDREISRPFHAAGENCAPGVRQSEVQGGVRQDRCAAGDYPVRRPQAVHRVRQEHGGARRGIPLPADGQEVKNPLGADLVIPALALGFAAYFFVSVADLAWEAKANGVMIGGILVVLIAAQVIRIAVQVAKRKADLRFSARWEPRDALGKRVGMVLITIAFIATLDWLGLTLGLLLALFAALWIMGARGKTLAIVPLAVALAAYLLL